MSNAEYFANSMLLDCRGIHLVIWDDKGELVRALLIILAAINEIQVRPLLLSSAKESEEKLRELFEIQPI
ncbi:MAG: hypothetical protein ACE5G1_14450, partial [bacterium]